MHKFNIKEGTRLVTGLAELQVRTTAADQVRNSKSYWMLALVGSYSTRPYWLILYLSKKKDSQICYYIDFCDLNKSCPKDDFSFPNIDMLVDVSTGHSMFSVLDGFSGYNQIKMHPHDTEKTSFRTPIG